MKCIKETRKPPLFAISAKLDNNDNSSSQTEK